MNARELAYEVLRHWIERPTFQATVRLDQELTRSQLTGGARGLATELVHGVIRRRETLNAVLRRHVQRPLAQVEPGALLLLHLGTYQLVFLSGAPAYAVVNETAELAKRIGHPEWTGFVNGVLRSIGRGLTDEVVAAPGTDTVPLHGGNYRRMQGAVFADPVADPAGFFSEAFSFPRWLVDRWRTRFGRTDLFDLGFALNAPPRLTLRVNTMRTTREKLLAVFISAGIAAQVGAQPDAVRLDESVRVTDLPGFAEGWFAVQDESAIAATACLDPQPGWRVLDLCAAPGGKTTHLATLMHNQGQIIAADVDDSRLDRITESCQRLGIAIVETRKVRRDGTGLPEGPFDAVLVDAPCSNTGVLGKRPEARWRLKPSDIAELATLQSRLLTAALTRTAPTGRVVYSTCSIEPEENRGVVDSVLRDNPGWHFVSEALHLPGRPADGGYQALLIQDALWSAEAKTPL